MNRKVLVIEAEALQRDLMHLGLQRSGFEVVSVADTDNIQNLLVKHRPSVLVLDMFLPKINGLDLLKKLRADGLLVGVKVVAISSMAFKEVVQQAGRLGVEDFIIKPFDIDDLSRRLNQLLEEDES